MPPRFQRFLRTEGILGKVWCHIEEEYSIGLERGGFIQRLVIADEWPLWVTLKYRFLGGVHINLANKTNKQREKEKKRNKNGVGEKFKI